LQSFPFFSYFDVIYLLALNVWANRVQMITEYRDKMRFFLFQCLGRWGNWRQLSCCELL